MGWIYLIVSLYLIIGVGVAAIDEANQYEEAGKCDYKYWLILVWPGYLIWEKVKEKLNDKKS